MLSRAKWDTDAVRDDIRGFVVGQLHDDAAALVVDESGDRKRGSATVGVQRQYTGTAGRIENSQVAVRLAYSAPAVPCGDRPGTVCPTLLDRGPGPLPGRRNTWPIGFTTKPALATRMIGRALDADVPASWVAGDEFYGGNPHHVPRTGLIPVRLPGSVAADCHETPSGPEAGRLKACPVTIMEPVGIRAPHEGDYVLMTG
ncbi:transposase [Streptomyces sp. NPDC017991]|uniref:transposase n=1 Tax=Streptomyces sp. NPDC017991 TaxID=3365026 RepID=UPI003799C24A